MGKDIYDKISTLSKRRGFVYPSFEIYGGVAGFYNYGPLGFILKKNVEELWRRFYIFKEDFMEIDTPTITPYDVLKASGHVDKFTDLTATCRKCGRSYKVEDIRSGDKIICPNCGQIIEDVYETNLMFSTTIGVGEERKAFLRPETAQGIFTDFHLLYRFNREKLPFGVVQVGRGYRNEIAPRQGVIRLREFSMAEAEIFFDPEEKSHPRFKEVKDKKIPLYIDDIIRNIRLDDAVESGIINNNALAYYLYFTYDFLITCGIDPKKIRFRKHDKDELAHYATECWDAELYSERFGWVECVGIADRSAHDLEAHFKASGVDMRAMRRYNIPKTIKREIIVANMDYIGPTFKNEARRIKEILEKKLPSDIEADGNISIVLDKNMITIPKEGYSIVHKEEKIMGEKVIPHVIEPSYGIDRIIYHIMEHNYVETKKNGEEYHLLKLPSYISPIKVGIFPLTNDKKLCEIAREIEDHLKMEGIKSYYDDSGSIGRRYARMDEIGTPFCITVDTETKGDNMVTVRYRDTAKQDRIKINKIIDFLNEKLKFP